MNPCRPFIVRPVATVLLMVALTLSGWVAYQQLPVSALPQVDYPTIQVTTFQPGASPEVVTSSITVPLERQFGQMPGLAQMTSTSSEGCSVIVLRFDLALNIDIAAQQVQAAINAATTILPRDLPSPPVYTKSNPADAPILTLALVSQTLPLSRVQDLADTRFAQKISQLSGVGLVSISGGQKPAVRVQVNPQSLAAVDLSLEDVRAALMRANVNQAKGSFDGASQAFVIGANDQLLRSDQYRDLIIAYRDSAPVYLRDVAAIVDGVENLRQAAWWNETPAVILNVQRQPGANIIDVVDRITALLPQLKESLPESIDVQVLTDRTATVRAAVHDVQRELLTTIGLVVLVIFLFLRNVSATTIPGVAVPLSIVGTFGVMYLLGYSLNNLTLMALTISTGFVVDDAIVMVENIMRYVEQGESPLTAALHGSQQIAFTVVSLSVSLVAVLIPLLFMGDIVGRLFREFAVTLSVAILLSAVVSLTLTPMMSARLLRHGEGGLGYWITWPWERFFEFLTRVYALTLDVCLRFQGLTLLVAVATVLATWYLYQEMPKGFFPVQDTGVILGIAEAPQDISFEAMSERQLALHRVIAEDPAVENVSGFIGIDGINTTLNTGRVQITLKPFGARSESAIDVIRRLNQQLEQVAGITLYLQPVQDLTVETRVSRTQYQYSLECPDPLLLRDWSSRLIDALRDQPLLRDVAGDDQNRGRQLKVVIDRDTASRLGVTPQMIDDALYDSFGQRQISIMFTQVNQYRLILEVAPKFRDQARDLDTLYIRGAGDARIPLSALARVEHELTPLAINHQGQFPVTTISFNLAPGVSLGEAVAAINATRDQLGLPTAIVGGFQGTAAAFEASLRNTPLLILAALVTVYIVLGVLYESYIHPLTILSTLPSAGVGALLALRWAGLDLSLIALIGIILLIGIVKKNAIMMIDFALDARRTDRLTPLAAIRQACLLRFRPIMMTTLAALLGAVPLALGTGSGSELRRPLGITIIGGLLFSQVLTLYTTPVIYLAFDWLAERCGFRQSPAEPVASERGDL
jgi:multidrug efflux pump